MEKLPGLLAWLLAACGLLLLPAWGQAQAVSTYTVAGTPGTYTELTSGTAVPLIQADNAISAVIPLGFTFVFEGRSYTQVRAASDGFLSFNASASRTGINDLSTGAAARRPLVAPLWDDLDGQVLTPGAASLASYRTTGTAPARVFAFEWRNWEWNRSADAAVISFQVLLYEETGQVQFVYRPEAAVVNSGSASIGLSGVGSGPGSFVSLQNTAASPAFSSAVETRTLNTRPLNGQVYTFTPPAPCGGVPTPGVALVSRSPICAGTTTVLSLAGSSVASGLTYRWQSSPDNVTYTDIADATAATYTTTITASTWFRGVVSCPVVNQSAFSAPVRAELVPVAYAALPVLEDFEGVGAVPAWLSVCDTRSVPSLNWRTVPATGNTSWRRYDDAAAANWSVPTDGSFGPTASSGSFSARFHSTQGASGEQGSLDLYVDLSGPGTNTLSFDYRNFYGSDRLDVLLSTDGGQTFAAQPLLTLTNNVRFFTRQSVTFGGGSATSVIRLQATAELRGLDDIGLDNLRLEPTPACAPPVLVPVTMTTATSATIAFATPANGTAYTLSYTPDGGTPTQLAVTASPVVLTGLLPGTRYTVGLSAACGSSGSSITVGTTFNTIPANDECAGAVVLTPGLPGAACAATVRGTTSAATESVPGVTCGTYGDDDVWYAFTATSAQHFITVAAEDELDVQVNLRSGLCSNTTSLICENSFIGSGHIARITASNLSVGTTYFVRIHSRGATYIGRGANFTVCVTTPAACTAPTAVAVVVNSIRFDQAVISFVPGNGATGGFTLRATPATGGGVPVVVNGAASPLSLTGLSAATTYSVVITSNCDAGATAASTPALLFQTSPTPPANDDPAGAIALPLGATCVPVTATNLNATETVPNGYTNGGLTRGCDYNGNPRDVWFTFTTAASGPGATGVVVGVNGSVAGLVRVFSAPGAGGPFTRIDCSASNIDNQQAPPVYLQNLTPATTYYVSVAGYASNSFTGSFTICVVEAPACGPATNVSASASTSTTGTITFQAYGGVAAYTVRAVSVADSSVVTVSGPASPLVLTGLTPGDVYTVTVVSDCGGGATAVSPQAYTLRLPALVPANDDPAGAIALPLSTTCTPLTGTARAATTTTPNGYVNGVAPDCAAARTPIDVWYTLTTAAAGQPGSTAVTLTATAPTGFGNPAGQLRVFSAPSANGPFTQVACAAGSSNAAAPPLTITTLDPATTYYVRVAGYEETTSSGPFALCAVAEAVVTGTRAQLGVGQLSAYPNPTRSAFTLKLPALSGERSAYLTLLNSLGQVVYEHTLALQPGGTETTVPVQHLPTGIYLMRVRAGASTGAIRVAVE